MRYYDGDLEHFTEDEVKESLCVPFTHEKRENLYPVAGPRMSKVCAACALPIKPGYASDCRFCSALLHYDCVTAHIERCRGIARNVET